MQAEDSILASSDRRVAERRGMAGERRASRAPGHAELQARIQRHQSTMSPLLVAALVLAPWTAVLALDATLPIPGGAHAWAWLITVVTLAYGWLARRAPARGPGAGVPSWGLLVAAVGILGTGLAMVPVAPDGPDGRLLAPLVLAVGAACACTLMLRLELLVASLAVVVLPLAFARLGGPGADPLLVALLLGAGVILCAGGIGAGVAFGRALRNDMEQRALLKRLEETNQALSADRVALQTESRTDPLTGLANRRYLEETLQAEWNRCRRSGAPLSCVMLDIDHFKAYNDHYGHDGGDICLRRIAAILSDSTRRAGDVVARYGGEEFVVLLPETGGDGATTVAEFLKRAVSEAGIPHAKSPLAPVVTVSQGVATLVPEQNRVPQELLKAADLALYEAKGAGRNRVVLADDDTLDSARMAARGLIG